MRKLTSPQHGLAKQSTTFVCLDDPTRMVYKDDQEMKRKRRRRRQTEIRRRRTRGEKKMGQQAVPRAAGPGE